MTKPTNKPLREKIWGSGEAASQWMKRQRLMRAPHTNANGRLASNATTTSLDAMKKKTNQNNSPSSSPNPNPLREKTGGLRGRRIPGEVWPEAGQCGTGEAHDQ